MSTERQISDFITSVVKASHPAGILGAELGARVVNKFPTFKQQFGRLRWFITKNCANEVIGQPTANLDYLWFLASKCEVPKSTVSNTDSNTQFSPKFWSLFNTIGELTKQSAILCIDPSNGTLIIKESGVAGPNLKEIPTLSASEYRQIIVDFVTTVISEEDRPLFNSVMDEKHLRALWFSAIRNMANGKYLKPWGEFRFNSVMSLFQNRLETLAIPSNLILVAVRLLKESKENSKAESFGGTYIAHQNRKFPTFRKSASSDIRHTVSSALAEMSDEQLRQIWLPVGVIINALQRK
jgi:hypothetical protein